MEDTDDFFRDAEQRMEKLWEQFSFAPEVTVVGVVSPFGAGGSSDGQGDIWTLTFSFASWRSDTDDVQESELSIHQRLSHDELKAIMNMIEPYEVLRARVRLVVDSVLETPQAELIELIGADDDGQLRQIATKLQIPITVQDERFGTLTLDRRLDLFDGQVTWNGKTAGLTIEAIGEQLCPNSLSAAKQLIASEESWGQRIDDYAVKMLHGKTWLEEEDEVELTRAEFLSRMKLTDIGVSSDGSFEFWHEDGDLFWGHSIVIYGDLENGPTSLDTPG